MLMYLFWTSLWLGLMTLATEEQWSVDQSEGHAPVPVLNLSV